MKDKSTFPPRQSRSIKADTAGFFAERRARADFKTFDRLMRRKGGEMPRADDKVKP
jgi:hypothetical protein